MDLSLKDLHGEEQIAFAALIKAVVLADHGVSSEEREQLEDIVDEIGEAEYQHALDEVERRFPDEDKLRAFLKTITRPEARDLIYGTVFEMAVEGAVEGRESDLLTWLAKEWDIKVEFEAPEGAGDE